MAANDEFVANVASLQKAVKQSQLLSASASAAAAAGEGVGVGVGGVGGRRVVRLLVLRWADPRSMVKVPHHHTLSCTLYHTHYHTLIHAL